MSKKQEKNWLVALDIGTSKVVALVADITEEGQLEILGVGVSPSRGLKRGAVVNIDATVSSIRQAVEDAENTAGCQINAVYTGIAGGHIRSFNSHGIVAIRDREVSPQDVEKVLEAAKAVAIPADQKILHVLPQEFIVDQQQGIRDPIGMSGVRLEAKVHMVTGAVSAAQNIVKCVRRCGLEVEDMILQPLASSYAVLTEDEKQLGVCLIDIGGGTTDLAVFSEGALRHSAVIPIAGDQVTSDIAVALRVPTQDAEYLKLHQGCASPRFAYADEWVEVAGLGDRPARQIGRAELAEVIEPRYEELFQLISQEVERSGFGSMLHAGWVLTGGSARLKGVVELAESLTGLPVRLGIPRQIQGLVDAVKTPGYATAVGLLHYGCQVHQQGQLRGERSGFRQAWSRVKGWLQVNF